MTMITPKKEHFTLVSATLIQDGGVKMKHFLEVPGKGVVDTITGNEDITIEPHEEFSKNFDALKPTVAKIYKFDSHRTIILAKEFKATGKQAEIAEKHYQELLNSIKIKGVKLSNWDTEDNKQVVIMAEFTDDYGHVLPLNTKEIHLTQTKIGTEADVQKACETIADEAFKYRYEGKRKQLEIPGMKAPSKSGKVVEMKKGQKETAKAN